MEGSKETGFTTLQQHMDAIRVELEELLHNMNTICFELDARELFRILKESLDHSMLLWDFATQTLQALEEKEKANQSDSAP